MNYVIITPIRNEADYIEKTINSILSQTVQPLEWIIVNDGSTDNTGEIVDQYAKEISWIKVIHRKDRGFRQAGSGVIEAFYDGYKSLSIDKWDYIIKLDGDLSFEKEYFKKCFDMFESNPKIGIGGGAIYHEIQGKLILEKTPKFHVRGATKIYRKKCWNDITGLIHAPGWDTLDEVKANMMGWKTSTFNDLIVIHHRFTGMADGTWKNLVKNGKANYISGYHPIFMYMKCIKRLFRKPFLIGSVALLYGYISSFFKKIPQVEDKVLIKYLRKQQLYRLIGKKSIWN